MERSMIYYTNKITPEINADSFGNLYTSGRNVNFGRKIVGKTEHRLVDGIMSTVVNAGRGLWITKADLNLGTINATLHSGVDGDINGKGIVPPNLESKLKDDKKEAKIFDKTAILPISIGALVGATLFGALVYYTIGKDKSLLKICIGSGAISGALAGSLYVAIKNK